LNNYTSLVDFVIKEEMKGRPRHEQVLLLGPTPSYLVDKAGFPALELAIMGRVIGKAYFDHGITKSILKRLSVIADNPKCLFQSANSTQTDSVVVLTFELKGETPIVVPIRKNRRIGRLSTYNLITSVYGKEGPDPEVKWKEQGLLLWEP